MDTETQNKEQLINEIETTLALVDGEKINICYVMLRIIKKASEADQPGILRHVAECFDDIESSGEIKLDAFINQDEKDQLKKRYGDLVDKMFELILQENPSEDQFYVSLWQTLNNPILSDENARVFALYYILIDSRIPYFHLEQGLRMSDDDWKTIMARQKKQQAKLRFILATPFSQRSEEADLLLREIDAMKGPERVVLLGSILFRLRQETKRIKDLLQRNR